MYRILFALAVILLTSLGCDKVVGEKFLPTYTETREVSCTYGPSFCCGFGMDMMSHEYKYSCGFKMSCDGKQQARVKINPKEVTYESGKKAIYTDTTILERTSSCR